MDADRTERRASPARRLRAVGPATSRPGPVEASVRSVPLGLSPGWQLLALAVAIVFAGVALTLGLRVEPLRGLDVARAVGEALAIALPVAAGLYALRREQTARFARVLIIAGLGYAPAALALSTNSVAYSIGRTWALGIGPLTIYLLLAFPLGRLSTRVDRRIVGTSIAVVLVLFVPLVAFVQFPVPSPWTGCTTDCPANALKVAHHVPHLFVQLGLARDIVSAVVYAAAAATVWVRWLRGSWITRRVHGTVVVVALVHFLAASAFFAARRAAPTAQVTEALAIVWLLCIPALVLAYLAGLLRWRVIAFGTWRRFSPAEQGVPGAAHIRELLADAIGDPSLEVGYWGGAQRRWIDEDGRPFALPPEGTVRALTEVTAGGKPVAVLVHERSYMAQPAIREVVQGVTLMALANQREQAEGRAVLRELNESRLRILTTIDHDRLQLERDLHDGAQQRLIALKIAADRGAEAVAREDSDAAALFRRIGADASAALDEVRALARGVYPALLVDHGLVEALRDVAGRSTVPTTLRAKDVRRYPQEIEAAVYFSCLEALQNAEKHSGADQVTIDVVGNGKLSFEVRDNGIGFDTSAHRDGAGLGNMADRVAAIGGELHVESVPGGTRVSGTVPMLPDHVPAEIERLVLRAADALEDAMGIYRAVRTSSGVIVDFAVEHVNDAACAIVGLPRDAQVGKTLGQLRPGYVRTQAFEWHCSALQASAPLVRTETEYAEAAGGRKLQSAYEVRAAALGAGRIALVWRDVTDRERAARQLHQRASALASERDGVCIVRAETGTIVYANPRMDEMFGYDSGALEGRPASVLDWPGDPGRSGPESPHTRPRWRSADRFEAGCRRKDGELVWCEVTIDGFEDEDLGWCWVTTHHDVTDAKRETRLVDEQRTQLGLALRNVPALAYSADRDLRCRLLFDSLVEPGRVRMPLTGRDAELFGPGLAPHVAKLNRRAAITERPVQEEVYVGADGLGIVRISVEPIDTPDGSFAGVVGSVVDRSSPQTVADLSERTQRTRVPRVLRRQQ